MKSSLLIQNCKKAILLVCLFLCLSAYSQVELSKEARSAYHTILAGNFNTSVSGLSDYETVYLSQLQLSLNLLVHEEGDFDTFEVNFDQSLEVLKASNAYPLAGYLESEVRLWASLIYLKFEKQLDAGWQFRQAYREALQLYKTYPKIIPNNKNLGAMKVLLGAVPQKYQWVLSVAGMEGSIEDGLTLLQKAASANTYVRNEANILLTLINAYVLEDFETAFQKTEIFPENPLASFIKFGIYAKCAQGQLLLLKQVISEFPQATYFLAEAHLQAGNHQQSNVYFHYFLDNFSGSTNRKDAYFKLFLNYKSLQSDSLARYYRALSETTVSKSAADRVVKNLLTTDVNLSMLKLRYAIDGGFYQRADSLVRKVQTSNKRDSVELIYRQARLQDKRTRYEQALSNYEKAIELQEDNSWYFAPNAALHAGYILEKRKDYTAARSYFNKAQQYKRHEYKNSIDSKAEAALNRIKAL